MKKEELTPNQARVLEALQDFVKEKGYVPSMKEVADKVGYKGASALTGMYRILERKGYIQKIPKTARAVRLIEK